MSNISCCTRTQPSVWVELLETDAVLLPVKKFMLGETWLSHPAGAVILPSGLVNNTEQMAQSQNHILVPDNEFLFDIFSFKF